MTIAIQPASLDDVVETLKFLGDKNRLRLLSMLRQTEMCVCDLYDQLDLAQNLVSYHLTRLKKAGLVRSRRDGTWIYYSIDPEGWERLLAPLAAHLQLGPLPPEAAYGSARRCDPPLEESEYVPDRTTK